MGNNTRVILVHGWGGFPNEGWRPWLTKELEERSIKVFNPSMPNTHNPSLDKWVKRLAEVIGKPNNKTYIIGHSLGVITILRYLESLKHDEQIGGVVFVAGFANDLSYKGYKGELTEFVKKPLDWEKIQKHTNQFVIIHSEDDPWVSVDQYHYLNTNLKATSILTKGMKHFSGDDGITKAPLILESFLQLS